MKDGLCSTCDNARTCGYLPSRQGPVFHCEEFSAFTPPEVRARKPSLQRSGADNPRAKGVKPNDLLGLCCSCEDWEICTLPRSEGGVWHCEQFR